MPGGYVGETGPTQASAPKWRIGLTGPIAAGKSTAAACLRHLGAYVIDHDVLARQVVEPGGPGLAAVVEAFGRVALAGDGRLDRVVLGRIVFADEQARQTLEAITHPLIHEAACQAEHIARRNGEKLVIHDIPLLVETADPADFGAIIVVDAPAALRLERLMNQRGLTRQAALARMDAQADDMSRRAIATVVWDGSRTPEALRAQALRWLVEQQFLRQDTA